MVLSPDFDALKPALRIAHRLATVGQRHEGFSLWRELLAGAVDLKSFELMEAWIPRSRPPTTGFIANPDELPSVIADPDELPNVIANPDELPNVIETLAASGFAAEATRVMATCVELVPSMGAQFVDALRAGFSQSLSKVHSAETTSENAATAATDLARVGMEVLNSGHAGGIILLGVAHRVADRVPFRISEIEANLYKLPYWQPTPLKTEEAQALTEAAYDLHFRGRQEPAVRVGSFVPLMLSTFAADEWFNRLQHDAKPGTERFFQASREIFEKGYRAEAFNLLIDSDSVSTEEVWSIFDNAVHQPSWHLRTPGWFTFHTRRLWRDLFRRSKVLAQAIKESPIDSVEKRYLNAWIDDPRPIAGKIFHVLVNIGAPNHSAVSSVAFANLDWDGVEFIELVIAIYSVDCDVEPSWHELKLPRAGESETIKFAVTPEVAGDHEFSIRVYLAKQMIQLQSLSFTVTVAAAELQPAEA
jgi:hypothetical protein